MAAAVAADPEVALQLWEGDGSDALANVNASQPGVKLRLGATHWLREASGGADFALWSQLEMAIASACYFDADALDAVKVVDTALSPAAMAGITRAALNAGMERSSKGSIAAALVPLGSIYSLEALGNTSALHDRRPGPVLCSGCDASIPGC